MVNITREDSLSNWFSSLQAIVVGAVLWLTSVGVNAQMRDNYYKWKSYGWAGIGSFFIYLGIDDAIKFHERMGTAFKVLFFDNDDTFGTGVLVRAYDAFPSYTWQLVFGPVFVSIGIFMIWFLWKELSSRKLWYWFLVGISLYAVAVGLDFVEGLDGSQYEEMGITDFFSTSNHRIRHMSKALEEFLEMLGTTIFLIIFLKNIFRLSGEWRIHITNNT
ncbi:permease component [Candidatus Scalindua japonica]|uniref:Permease component n=2 Tax=Candidatus Scalindua japonica TaxID=1284222 RepID=A0A286TTY3_9BACT|nr:permease component [Candidatus Scalindua japonica]